MSRCEIEKKNKVNGFWFYDPLLSDVDKKKKKIPTDGRRY